MEESTVRIPSCGKQRWLVVRRKERGRFGGTHIDGRESAGDGGAVGVVTMDLCMNGDQ